MDWIASDNNYVIMLVDTTVPRELKVNDTYVDRSDNILEGTPISIRRFYPTKCYRMCYIHIVRLEDE